MIAVALWLALGLQSPGGALGLPCSLSYNCCARACDMVVTCQSTCETCRSAVCDETVPTSGCGGRLPLECSCSNDCDNPCGVGQGQCMTTFECNVPQGQCA